MKICRRPTEATKEGYVPRLSGILLGNRSSWVGSFAEESDDEPLIKKKPKKEKAEKAQSKSPRKEKAAVRRELEKSTQVLRFIRDPFHKIAKSQVAKQPAALFFRWIFQEKERERSKSQRKISWRAFRERRMPIKEGKERQESHRWRRRGRQ